MGHEPVTPDIPIPIAISARHAHLCQATVDRLYGVGYILQPRSALSQPKQYAACETVNLVGPQGRLDHVRVLGPPRASDQIELARTDELHLGLNAPLRLSGDLQDTPGLILEGPAGRVALAGGVVRPVRHIHMSPEDAQRLKVRDHEIVRVAVEGTGRDVVFGQVIVRVSPDFKLELHLDTDEGNAAGVTTGCTGRLIRSASG